MDGNQELNNLFKESLPAFYFISKKLPKNQQLMIARIFVFLKKTQVYLDTLPPEIAVYERYQTRLKDFRNQMEIYQNNVLENLEDDFLLESFINLEVDMSIPENWGDTLLETLKEFTLSPQTQSWIETKALLENSSEIVGKIIAKSLELPPETLIFAGKIATSFCLLDWVRAIPVNVELNRLFFPVELLKKHNLKNLSEAETRAKPDNFQNFIKEIISLSQSYWDEGSRGFIYLLDKHKPALESLEMYYNWLKTELLNNPFAIYQEFIEPSGQVILNWKVKTIFSK